MHWSVDVTPVFHLLTCICHPNLSRTCWHTKLRAHLNFYVRHDRWTSFL